MGPQLKVHQILVGSVKATKLRGRAWGGFPLNWVPPPPPMRETLLLRYFPHRPPSCLYVGIPHPWGDRQPQTVVIVRHRFEQFQRLNSGPISKDATPPSFRQFSNQLLRFANLPDFLPLITSHQQFFVDDLLANPAK